MVKYNNFLLVHVWFGVRVSVVSLGSHYMLDGSVFELRCGQHFLHPSTPAPRPTQPHVQWLLWLFTGSKLDGTWC